MTLIYLALAWVAGIIIAALVALPALAWLWLLLIPVGYLWLWWGDRSLRRFHFSLIALVLGALRYQAALPSPIDQALARFNELGPVSLTGIVVDEPDRRAAYTDLRVQVSRVQNGQAAQATSGLALVQAPRDAAVRYGDEIQIDGEPLTPPSGADFSYRDFLARQKVFTLIRYARVQVLAHDRASRYWAALYDCKAAALDVVRSLLPEPAAALLNGILLGHDQDIPAELQDAFQRTNTAHVIAISGFNIGLLALYLGKLLRRALAFSPALADVMLIAGLLLYTLLVGASASVVRAAITGCLGVIALHYGRQGFALNSLAAAALLMTLLNPFSLWDLGFQLSFLATLGLVLYGKRMTEWVSKRLSGHVGQAAAKPLLSFLGDSLLVTLAAWLMTTPLLVAIFHRFSLVGLLTNILILPVQPPIMILGGFATLAGLGSNLLSTVPLVNLLVSSIAHVLGWATYVFLQFTILVVEWTARLPFAAVETPRLEWALVLPVYALILLLTHFSPRQIASSLFSRPAFAAASLAVTAVLVWTAALAAPDPRTHVQFLASSGGDAVFIRTASDGRILIDGGADPNALLAHLGEQLPFWDRRLDLVVATHLDESNLASLNAVLERYDVGQILAPARESGGASLEKWQQLLASREVAPAAAEAGTELRADEVTLRVLGPAGQEPGSAVGLVVAASTRTMLFIPALDEKELAALRDGEADLSAELAVLPHRFDQALLDRIRPETIVLYAGRGVREQPVPESLQLLEGLHVLRTDERGDIELVVDGEKVEMKTER